jgi:hypothetical protein
MVRRVGAFSGVPTIAQSPNYLSNQNRPTQPWSTIKATRAPRPRGASVKIKAATVHPNTHRYSTVATSTNHHAPPRARARHHHHHHHGPHPDDANLDSPSTPGTTDVLIRITPPDSTDGFRAPSDVVCVVDVSGSMAKSATIQAAKGEPVENDGLTVLDITKHAVRTIIHSLKPGDNFSLVSYSNSATTNLPLTSMDEDGKRRASQILDTLTPGE